MPSVLTSVRPFEFELDIMKQNLGWKDSEYDPGQQRRFYSQTNTSMADGTTSTSMGVLPIISPSILSTFSSFGMTENDLTW